MKDIKAKVIRGGLAKVSAQAASFGLRIGSLMVLARLLDPKDFGLVGMVTAVSGVLGLFMDFGLSSAAVQRGHVTHAQSSTLFWVNLAVGCLLAGLLMASAPFLVRFYHQPELFRITMILSMSFIINSLGIQHSAILQREMRFTTIARNTTMSLVISVAVGIAMAALGCGYWSLVGMTVSAPIVTTIAAWCSSGWIPGRPQRGIGMRSLIRFGGTVTLNGLVVYVAYNLEKVLLGRFWGLEAVGLYGRSYQLINIPTKNLTSAAGEVAFPALSRVRDDPARFRNYFLKGYALLLALTIPVTFGCAVFADDLVLVLLGKKWSDAAPIFRLLAPTILIFGLINPLGWVMFSLGLVNRSLKISCVLAPLVIAGYGLGLPYGPKGVAFGYSAILMVWLVPHIAWCIHGTPISLRDIGATVGKPFLSGVVAGLVGAAVQWLCQSGVPPLPRLLLGATVFATVYACVLLIVMKQKAFYLELVRGLKKSPAPNPEVAAAA